MAREEEIIEQLGEENPEAKVLEPREQFNPCILGIARRFGMEPVLAYDENKILEALMKEGMTEEEAIDYYGFNMLGTGMDHVPVFVWKGGV